MKYLVISDNHSDEQILYDIISKHKNEVDYIFHCGDSEMSKKDKIFEDVYNVRGNCDFETFDDDITVDCVEDKIFATHGHMYQVNFDLMNLKYKALEVGANIAFYGHTHVPLVEYSKDDNLLIVNPGSISQPRIIPAIPTYAIVESNKDKYIVTYYDREDNKVDSLSKVIER